MTSKNRITVNFSSEDMIDVLKSIKEETGRSVSKIIEELIEFRLLKYERTSVVRKVVNNARHRKGKSKVPDVNYKVALKKTGFKNGISFGGGYGDIYGVTDVVLKRKLVRIFHSSQQAENDIRKAVREKIKEEIRSQSFKAWEQGCFSHLGMQDASYFLVLIEKVLVTLYVNDEPYPDDGKPLKVDDTDTLFIEYTARNVYGIPFVFENTPSARSHELTPYLDFNRVCYKTFADYAQNGWDRSKHSHLIYIERATKSTKGGFFIGVLYNKNRQLSGRSIKKRLDFGTEVKVCFAHDFLRIEKISSLSEESVRQNMSKGLNKMTAAFSLPPEPQQQQENK